LEDLGELPEDSSTRPDSATPAATSGDNAPAATAATTSTIAPSSTAPRAQYEHRLTTFAPSSWWTSYTAELDQLLASKAKDTAKEMAVQYLALVLCQVLTTRELNDLEKYNFVRSNLELQCRQIQSWRDLDSVCGAFGDIDAAIRDRSTRSDEDQAALQASCEELHRVVEARMGWLRTTPEQDVEMALDTEQTADVTHVRNAVANCVNELDLTAQRLQAEQSGFGQRAFGAWNEWLMGDASKGGPQTVDIQRQLLNPCFGEVLNLIALLKEMVQAHGSAMESFLQTHTQR
jgi:hypothetical protein